MTLDLSTWPVGRAAAAVVDADGIVDATGDVESTFALASVTKVLAALAVLVAVEEETVALDTAAGPPGSTVRHLLAHASGLPFEGDEPVAPPDERRIYSNTGIEVVCSAVGQAAGMAFDGYAAEAVFAPLGLTGTSLGPSPAHGGLSCVADLAVVARELLRPSLLARSTVDVASTVQFPDLAGLLPGFGHQRPNPWGLGLEIRGAKQPHWTGAGNSPRTFGHFGRSGTFLWVDPAADLALVVLTDTDFGPWAAAAWPALSDAVLTRWSA